MGQQRQKCIHVQIPFNCSHGMHALVFIVNQSADADHSANNQNQNANGCANTNERIICDLSEEYFYCIIKFFKILLHSQILFNV